MYRGSEFQSCQSSKLHIRPHKLQLQFYIIQYILSYTTLHDTATKVMQQFYRHCACCIIAAFQTIHSVDRVCYAFENCSNPVAECFSCRQVLKFQTLSLLFDEEKSYIIFCIRFTEKRIEEFRSQTFTKVIVSRRQLNTAPPGAHLCPPEILVRALISRKPLRNIYLQKSYEMKNSIKLYTISEAVEAKTTY